MLSLILGVLPGFLAPVLNYFTAAKNAQVAIYQARTGAAASVAEEAIRAQAQQNVQSKWWQPQTLIGMSIAIYVAKSVIYDKVIASFVGCSGHQLADTCVTFATDPFVGDLHWVFITVITGYFGLAVVDKFLNAR